METMIPETQKPGRHQFRTVLILAVSVFVVGFIFRLTEAGSLTPATAPATDSMPSLASISDVLVGDDYDSSDVTAKKDHNILNWTKCIIGQLKGFDRCAFDFDKSPSPICVAGLGVNYSATQIASFSWNQVHSGPISRTVAVSEYHFTLSPSVFASSQYQDFVISLGCAYEGVNVASISMCNGSACDYCVTTVTVSDPLAVCP